MIGNIYKHRLWEGETEHTNSLLVFFYLLFKEVIWHTEFPCDNNYSRFVHTCTPIQSLSDCLCMYVSAQLCLYCVIHCSDLWIESEPYDDDDNDVYKKTATSTNCIKLKKEEQPYNSSKSNICTYGQHKQLSKSVSQFFGLFGVLWLLVLCCMCHSLKLLAPSTDLNIVQLCVFVYICICGAPCARIRFQLHTLTLNWCNLKVFA